MAVLTHIDIIKPHLLLKSFVSSFTLFIYYYLISILARKRPRCICVYLWEDCGNTGGSLYMIFTEF